MLLPPAKLREYLGPAAVTALEPMAAGEISDALPAPGGYRVLVLLEREEDENPAFEAIESEIRSEVVRRNGDRALRTYLNELRERAEVRIADLEP